MYTHTDADYGTTIMEALDRGSERPENTLELISGNRRAILEMPNHNRAGFSRRTASMNKGNTLYDITQSPNRLSITFCLASHTFLYMHEYVPVIC